MGVPRRWMSIHHGDGFDVLDGAARVVNVDAEDISEPFRQGAQALLALARERGARLAILTDISPMCGSSVVYRGEALPDRAYQPSSGVGAALLRRSGIPVVSQRDQATLQALLSLLDPGFSPDPEARNFHEQAWYQQTFIHPAPPGPEPVFEDA